VGALAGMVGGWLELPVYDASTRGAAGAACENVLAACHLGQDINGMGHGPHGPMRM
jgi:hypothetical protein